MNFIRFLILPAVAAAIVSSAAFWTYILFNTHGQRLGLEGFALGTFGLGIAAFFFVLTYAIAYAWLTSIKHSSATKENVISSPGKVFLVSLLPSIILSGILSFGISLIVRALLHF